MASNSRQKSGSSDSNKRKRATSTSFASASSRLNEIKAQGGRRKAKGEDLGGVTVGLESRTIGDIQRQRDTEERKARRQRKLAELNAQDVKREVKPKRSKTPIIVAGVIIGLLISFAAMFFIIARTNVFEIEEVSITGTDHLTSQEVSALVTIPQGTTLLNVDTEAIEASLKRDAWIESVSVNRIFPHKLEINVHERGIGAIVEVSTGANQTIQNWAVSEDGMWLMVVPSRDTAVGKQLSDKIYEDAESALHVIGVPYGLQPSIGTYCTDENVNNALKIISDMTTDLADQLSVVTATDAESTQLTLKNNIEIAFGAADNIRDKERICLQIMEENPNVVYINVRVPDRPTWRSA